MVYGIISDSHGSLKWFKKSIEALGECFRYIHLGDYLYHGPRNPLPEDYNPAELAKEMKKYNFNYITGNCDSQVDNMVLDIPENKFYSIESFGNFNMFFTHGFTPSIEDSINLAIENNCELLFHGHTHISKIEKIDNLTIVNPGSISLPKNGCFKSGIKMILDEQKLLLEFINIENKEIYNRLELIK